MKYYEIKNACPATSSFFKLCDRVCKPGSVECDHLSLLTVADKLRGKPRATHEFCRADSRANTDLTNGVASDRVYSGPMLP